MFSRRIRINTNGWMETNRTAHARPTGRNQTGQNQLAAKFIKGVASQAVSQSIRCERRVNISLNEPNGEELIKSGTEC